MHTRTIKTVTLDTNFLSLSALSHRTGSEEEKKNTVFKPTCRMEMCRLQKKSNKEGEGIKKKCAAFIYSQHGIVYRQFNSPRSV